MPVESSTVIAAVGYGLVVGWGLGLRPQDRLLVLATEAITIVIGAIVWLTGPDVGSQAAVAAVSLSLGGSAALASSVVLGRRPDTG